MEGASFLVHRNEGPVVGAWLRGTRDAESLTFIWSYLILDSWISLLRSTINGTLSHKLCEELEGCL